MPTASKPVFNLKEPIVSQQISYVTPMLPVDELERLALSLLGNFSGQPVCVIREILRRAEFWLDATSTLNGGPSSELQKAFAALRVASPESL
jgi:hypothetical protein